MIERRIKELSIALEALSRIGSSYGALNNFEKINDLLEAAIKEAQEINNPTIHKPTPIDDEIPF